MSAHSTYDFLRHMADSWGLLVMTAVFLGFAAWPFRPGARDQNRDAANLIFKDDSDGE
ncbi:cbb3-type cytochrome c oxidase subunit 3 [Croceibacterium aestuarii]|uniref:cbb3-type cytochrome c oxidase subunit 3 n=1 Tax=Croceibacterium aestuarii TaxID=3064139 RepID=UPI00272EA768|nr:cbb3-type cytochrome c oxidase subunit 3 [Croceibacterium sp. D39]